MTRAWVASLKKLVRRSWDMAAYLTAVGAVLVSIGAALLLGLPKDYLPTLVVPSSILIMGGLAFVVIGGVKVLVEENQRRKEAMVSLAVVTAIANKLGADVDGAIETVERKLKKWKMK